MYMFRHSSLDNFDLQETDLEVYQTDHYTSVSTVLLIDLSHSMILYGEDRITPAKKVAMALSELIMRNYAKDSLDIIAFGNEAWDITIDELPYLQVGPFHTNTLQALERARHILQRKKNANRRSSFSAEYDVLSPGPEAYWYGRGPLEDRVIRRW